MYLTSILRSAVRISVRKLCTQSAVNIDLDLSFKNPCLEMQQYIQVPLFRNNEIIFEPSVEDIQEAVKIFTPTVTSEINYLTSAVDPDGFPEHDLPEVAFIGHSNVGKSSLLKAVFNKIPNLVRTSKKPGQTKTVNFFQVGNKMCLVDMPGYGYKQPKCFVPAVEGYLKSRRNLKKTFLLINGSEGFHAWDEVALDMLEEFRIPYGFILTKIDKAIMSRRLKSFLELQHIRDRYTSVSCLPQIFMISSITYEGIAFLQAFIAHITGNLFLKDDSLPMLQMPKQEPELLHLTQERYDPFLK